MGTNHRSKIKDIIRYVNNNLIAEEKRDIYCRGSYDKIDELGKKNIVPVTTTLLLLNSIVGNNTLIEGDVGKGKTRLASVVGSLLYQVPIEVFDWRRVVGSPGATINDIYATHDIAELNKGKDVAFLYLPFYMPILVIDELNRFSELEQNRIREGVANNVWNYANHSWKIEKQHVISAINPEVYGGTFTLNENLLDNYSTVLWPPEYSLLKDRKIVENADNKIKEMLGLEEEVLKFFRFYEENKNSPKKIFKKIKELQEITYERYKEKNIPLIYNGELEEVKREIESLEFTPEAMLFFYSVLAEANYSHKYGRNRFEDPTSDSSHDKRYLSTKIKMGFAGRFMKDWEDVSKMIAWYLEKDKVDVEDVKAGFIFSSPRRVSPEEEFYQQILNSQRDLPLRHAISKALVEIAYNNYTDFSNPNNPSFNYIRKAINILSGKEKITKGELNKIDNILKNTDHPLALEVKEAMYNYYLEQEYKDGNV